MEIYSDNNFIVNLNVLNYWLIEISLKNRVCLSACQVLLRRVFSYYDAAFNVSYTSGHKNRSIKN